MAHVGDELRLVLAGNLKLPALLSDLAEQASVLHRNCRLGSEGLDQSNDFLGECAWLVAPDDEDTHDSDSSSSTERASSRLLACSASNNREFSMAITAWSAKDSISATCLSSNGATLVRASVMTPIG